MIRDVHPDPVVKRHRTPDPVRDTAKMIKISGIFCKNFFMKSFIYIYQLRTSGRTSSSLNMDFQNFCSFLFRIWKSDLIELNRWKVSMEPIVFSKTATAVKFEFFKWIWGWISNLFFGVPYIKQGLTNQNTLGQINSGAMVHLSRVVQFSAAVS